MLLIITVGAPFIHTTKYLKKNVFYFIFSNFKFKFTLILYYVLLKIPIYFLFYHNIMLYVMTYME